MLLLQLSALFLLVVGVKGWTNAAEETETPVAIIGPAPTKVNIPIPFPPQLNGTVSPDYSNLNDTLLDLLVAP